MDVVGVGRIGHGIAACVAIHGYSVRLRDVKQRTETEKNQIRQKALSLVYECILLFDGENALREKPEEIMRKVEFVSGYDRVEEAFHIVEAVPENIEIKKAVYERLSEKTSVDAVLASASSSIRPSALAKFVKNPSRFLVTHWINPAELVPLVEVAASPFTSKTVLDDTVSFLKSCGKIPVVCSDSPGYVSARLQAALMNEALRLVEEGVASPESVDKALMAGIGFRLAVQGLLEFLDWGGVDILHKVDNYLASELNAERFKPPAILKQLVEKQHFGMDKGRGIYDYSGVDVEALKTTRKKQMINRLKQLGILR